MPSDGEAYEIEHETAVPHERVPVNGDILRVRVSPHAPTSIEIDWSAQPMPAGRAATGDDEALHLGPLDGERQSDR